MRHDINVRRIIKSMINEPCKNEFSDYAANRVDNSGFNLKLKYIH